MAKESKIKKSKEAQKDKSGGASGNSLASRGEKRGWRHIIDKGTYSNGPGDNIYVFG